MERGSLLIIAAAGLGIACLVEPEAEQPIGARTLLVDEGGDDDDYVGFEEGLVAVGYTDTRDGGDDPWTGGCHVRWSDAACKKDDKIFKSDQCKSETELIEYGTIQKCHGPSNDKKAYDCDALCAAQGADFGLCVEDGTCADARKTHKCECFTLEDEPELDAG